MFGRIGQALRLAGFGALAAGAGLAAIAVVAELWLRSTVPFMLPQNAYHFVPKVGQLGRPGATVRATNGLDYWQIQRFNRYGFMDREPRNGSAAGCRVAVIGDSFVAAREVPIEAKMHVRLEAIAAAEGLRVRTAAFSRGGTGQVSQLAYYDEFARRWSPKLVVLIFHGNDYWENSLYLSALRTFRDPSRLPALMAERTAQGALKPRPPTYLEDGAVVLSRRDAAPSTAPAIRYYALVLTVRVRNWSYFGAWLDYKIAGLLPPETARPNTVAWAQVLREDPQATALMDAWLSSGAAGPETPFEFEQLPAPYARELEFTAFGLEQFRARAARDGASLVVLATHHLRPGTPLLERMRTMADELDIPVVSQYEHIVAQGGRPEEAHWPHDGHWSPPGHEWAAQALWGWLRRRPEICETPHDRTAGVR